MFNSNTEKLSDSLTAHNHRKNTAYKNGKKIKNDYQLPENSKQKAQIPQLGKNLHSLPKSVDLFEKFYYKKLSVEHNSSVKN